jgi:hypothetical protein
METTMRRSEPHQIISYEACQERPIYWDGLSHARRAPDGCNGDWRMSHTTVRRELPTIDEAVSYARRILGQRPGVPVEIWRQIDGRIDTRVAIVSRDALGRTWTDSMTFEALI